MTAFPFRVVVRAEVAPDKLVNLRQIMETAVMECNSASLV